MQFVETDGNDIGLYFKEFLNFCVTVNILRDHAELINYEAISMSYYK